MIIIDNIKEPAPIFTRAPKPEHFKSTYEKEKYWATEMARWVEGWNHLPGACYWYGTQVWLKNRLTGRLLRPEIRDVELLVFTELRDAMNLHMAEFILKGRGVGLSSIGMNLPHYFQRLFPGSKSIATSKDKDTLGTLFTDKTIICYEEMDPDIKPDLINKNQTKTEAYLKVGFKYLNEEDKEKYAECEFKCRDTQESDKAATNFSGSGAIYGFADEAPLMPRFQKFFDSARDVFTNHAENKMEGLLLAGGTCEDTIKPEDVARIKKIWYNAEAMRIRTLFIPATYGKHCVNGHSNHKKAEEEILKRREELASMPESLKAYIKNNPLTIDEIFDIGKGGRWEDDVTEILAKQEKIVLSTNPPIMPYVLVTSNNSTSAVVKKESPLLILEHPKEGIRYWMGIDGTATSKESSQAKNDEENSKFAFIIRKGYDPAGGSYSMVAEFEERPTNLEQTYRKAADAIRYYNRYGLLKVSAEGNAGNAEHFGNFLTNEGLKKVLDKRKKLDATEKEDKEKIFFYRDAGMMDWQYRQGNIDLRKYGHTIMFPRTLEAMLLPKDQNSDLTDAYLACQVGMGAAYDKKVEEKPPKKQLVAKTVWDSVKGWFIEWVEE
jgi:hypothetical protein